MTKYVTSILVLVVAVLAVALFVRGGEVMTALAISTTNSTVVTVNISGSTPTVSGMACWDADDATDYVKPVGGGQRFMKCNATFNDANGWGNIKNYTGNFSYGTCASASLVNCYLNATCKNTTLINTTAQKVECSYMVFYNAQNTSSAGDWFGELQAGDVDGLQSPMVTDAIDVQALLATGVNATLTFGARTVATNDSTCSVSYGTNVYNYGNVQMDVAVNASDMTCNGVASAIPAQYIHGNITPGAFYIDSYALTASLAGPNVALSRFDINLSASTSTTDPAIATARTIYWGIGIPSGIGGGCENVMWFAAQVS